MPPDPKLARAVAVSVARGMAYLHSRSPPILHLVRFFCHVFFGVLSLCFFTGFFACVLHVNACFSLRLITRNTPPPPHKKKTKKPHQTKQDLKSPNILVDERWRVKITDFGLSRARRNTYVTGSAPGGTPEWMAPEVLRAEDVAEPADVYSYGCVRRVFCVSFCVCVVVFVVCGRVVRGRLSSKLKQSSSRKKQNTSTQRAAVGAADGAAAVGGRQPDASGGHRRIPAPGFAAAAAAAARR